MFDIAITGAGAAGLQLALHMLGDAFFENKKILILEKDAKNRNDRTWCFWEKGEGQWDHLLRQRWSYNHFLQKKPLARPASLPLQDAPGDWFL
jgi:lycopene beta-cyclase